jgi:hypothetical protein
VGVWASSSTTSPTSTRPQAWFRAEGLPWSGSSGPSWAGRCAPATRGASRWSSTSRWTGCRPSTRNTVYHGVKPLRIDHFNMFSADVDASLRLLHAAGVPDDGIHRGCRNRRSGRPGCTARAACMTWPSPTGWAAAAPFGVLGADAAQHHRPARPDVDDRLGWTTSSAGPDGTASRTPSSSTSATPTCTGSRSIVRTTRPSIPTTSRSSGT